MLQPLLIAQRFGVLDYPRIFSRSQFFCIVGTAGGPLLLGWLYDNAGGYETSYLVAAACSFTGSLVLASGGPATVPRPVTSRRTASQRPARPCRRGGRPGLTIETVRFPDGAKTAADAAAAIGVDVGPIVKSLIFAVDGDVVLAYVSGANQLDERKLAAAAGGARCSRVDADTVRTVTGYPIGGVPPFGHATPLRVFVDPDLLAYDEVWAAAGTWNDVFAIAPADLVRGQRRHRRRPQALTRHQTSMRRGTSGRTRPATERRPLASQCRVSTGSITSSTPNTTPWWIALLRS